MLTQMITKVFHNGRLLSIKHAPDSPRYILTTETGLFSVIDLVFGIVVYSTYYRADAVCILDSYNEGI